MEPFAIVDPGRPGRDWIRYRLANGLTLCTLVLDALAEPLVVETLVPRGFTEQPLDQGFAGPAGLEAAYPWFIDQLARASASPTLIVAEDRIVGRGDQALENARARYVFYEDEVYVVAEGGASREELEVLQSEARSALSLVVFVGAPEDGFAPGREPTIDELRRYARSVRWIGVDAYDGDSYLVAHL